MDLTPDEQTTFDDLAARARELDGRDHEFETPPPEVWDSIEAALSPREGEPADPITMQQRRPDSVSRSPVYLLAVAALVVLLALGTWTLARDRGSDVVGRTDLTALDETGGVVGDAELIDADGSLRLQVNTESLDPGADNFLEVWVIDPDITELISLGPVRADGTYDLPAGIDPARFPIVDISREPLNGDPTHSGDSLVQGQLDFT